MTWHCRGLSVRAGFDRDRDLDAQRATPRVSRVRGVLDAWVITEVGCPEPNRIGSSRVFVKRIVNATVPAGDTQRCGEGPASVLKDVTISSPHRSILLDQSVRRERAGSEPRETSSASARSC
jgi:hypothetical protein